MIHDAIQSVSSGLILNYLQNVVNNTVLYKQVF